MKKLIPVIVVLVGLFSCNNQKQEERVQDATKTETTMATETKYEANMVDNRKDPSCGMPVSAGISDTAHYHGKVLGFCSEVCKEDFQKDPESFLAKAEMKE